MRLTIEQHGWPASAEARNAVFAIHTLIYRDSPEVVYDRAGPDSRLWLARVDGEPVGYKFGGDKQPQIFDSRMGGVHPDARGRGVARALMQQQHRDLTELGYRQVMTQTKNCFRPMLLLNLSEGFEVFGCCFPREEPLLLLRKRLDRPPSPPPTPSSPDPIEDPDGSCLRVEVPKREVGTLRSFLLDGFDIVGVRAWQGDATLELCKRLDGSPGFGPETYEKPRITNATTADPM